MAATTSATTVAGVPKLKLKTWVPRMDTAAAHGNDDCRLERLEHH
jgi:hypothetical protein